jgi:hypothetical protein
MSIPARNSRGFHLVFHPKSGEKHITSPISPSAQVPASNQAVLSNALQAASIPGSSPVLQWHPWHPLQIWSQLSTLERLLMLGICLAPKNHGKLGMGRFYRFYSGINPCVTPKFPHQSPYSNCHFGV